jgi:hypothetical protein
MTTLDRESVDTTQPAAPRTAVLDSAHVGDIEGALGRISLSDTDRPRTREGPLWPPCWRSSGPA